MEQGQGLGPWVVPGVTVTGNRHRKPSDPSPGGGFVLAARAAPAGLPPVDGPRQLSQGMAGQAGQEQALGKKSGSVLGGRLLPRPLAAAGDTHLPASSERFLLPRGSGNITKSSSIPATEIAISPQNKPSSPFLPSIPAPKQPQKPPTSLQPPRSPLKPRPRGGGG